MYSVVSLRFAFLVLGLFCSVLATADTGRIVENWRYHGVITNVGSSNEGFHGNLRYGNLATPSNIRPLSMASPVQY